MTRVLVEIIAMSGSQYVLYERDGSLRFPHGALHEGEAPAAAAKRIVQEWTGTAAPKLELVDLTHASSTLTLVFRAMLIDEPGGFAAKKNRMELPAMVGAMSGAYVEDALKTSLAYKLTRA